MLHNEWQSKVSSRWGHPLHQLCPYRWRVEPRLVHYFLHRFTHPGDVVLDPFCGSGTVALQACVEGRVGVGVDPSPLAHALTVAKLAPPDEIELRNRLDFLSNDMFFDGIEREPESVRRVLAPGRLSQLVYLRKELRGEDPADDFLRGVVLGLLQSDGRRGGEFLTPPLPSTLGPSPEKLDAYMAEKGLEAPEGDIFPLLRRRADWLLRYGRPLRAGRAHQERLESLAEAQDPALRGRKVQLICGAPPSLANPRHGAHNWLRFWFLGEPLDDFVREYDQPLRLVDWLDWMAAGCRHFHRVLRPGGACVLVLRDGERRGRRPENLAEALWAELKRRRTRFRLLARIDAPPASGKRRPGAPIERVLVLGKGDCRPREDAVPWG